MKIKKELDRTKLKYIALLRANGKSSPKISSLVGYSEHWIRFVYYKKLNEMNIKEVEELINGK